MDQLAGEIRTLIAEKGFGFIKDARGVRRFFHRSMLKGVRFEELREGQQVLIEPDDGKHEKGPRCAAVWLPPEDPARGDLM